MVPHRDGSLALSALVAGVGALLSGPVGMALVALRPQPAWKDAETFAAHFHPLQQAPYWFGFVLVAGCIWFVVRAAVLGWEQSRTRACAALVCASMFGAIIVINYTLQVAFVPHAARAHDPAVAYVVMANPTSISWTFEMFGYAALGAATWLVAATFRHHRWIHRLLIANGVVSLAGAVMTAIDRDWLMAAPGLISFVLWNVLLIGTLGWVALSYRPRAALT
jgi:hypothetical protein